MEEALRLKLLAASGIAGVVTSVAWQESPDKALEPRIVLSVISRGREYDHDGHDGLNVTRVRIDFYTSSVTQGWSLSRATIPAMETEEDRSGWHLGPAFLDADRDFDPFDMDGGRRVYRRSQDWLLMNRQLA